MVAPRPTATTYALLGLLALRPWTTYELVRQSERSLSWFFSRAERAIYLEAKRLVALRWAQAEDTPTGARQGTTYRITAAGRRALQAWLATPSQPARLESEGALKVFFADQSGLDDARATITGIRAAALDALDRLAAMAQGNLDGESPFPERGPTNVLSMRLVAEVQRTLADWADWAESAVEVLERGNAAAVQRQTRAAFADIARGADPPASGRVG